MTKLQLQLCNGVEGVTDDDVDGLNTDVSPVPKDDALSTRRCEKVQSIFHNGQQRTPIHLIKGR